MPKQIMFIWLAAFCSTLAPARPRALIFDVFGTCVDYQGSLLAEGEALNRERGWKIDWRSFGRDWVYAEARGIEAVRKGESPWRNLDEILGAGLAARLARFGGQAAADWQPADLKFILEIWHRFRAWPDTVPGLRRLHENFRLAPLSNGNRTLLGEMAEHASLPWDEILSAEDARHYKPDPEAYRYAIEALALPADQIVMVASHRYDLAAAAKAGMRTAFIPRAGEPETYLDRSTPPMRFDYQARSLEELADRLGARPN